MRAAAAAGFFERIDKNRLKKMPVIPKIPEMITTFTAASNVVPLGEGKNFRLDFYIKTVGIQGFTLLVHLACLLKGLNETVESLDDDL